MNFDIYCLKYGMCCLMTDLSFYTPFLVLGKGIRYKTNIPLKSI